MTGKGVGWRWAGHIRFKLPPRRINSSCFSLLISGLFAGADWFSLIGAQPDRSNALPSCARDHSSTWIRLPCDFVDSGVSGQESLVGMRMSLSRCDETERTVAVFVVV